MSNRRNVALAIAALMLAGGTMAANDEEELNSAGNDVDNIQSLQRGARNFMNYCSGCHSAQYVRYNTLARDLNLTDDQVADNLMFNADENFETIVASMPVDDARRWFGQAPPDVSLIARSKGTDYVYNFLKGFFVDAESPTGVDNLLLPGTRMPHVLWELQGLQRAIYRDEQVDGQEGMTHQVFDSFEQITAGSMSAEKYDGFARDTANFLEYIAEPERSTRRKVGTWVIIYLLFFLIIAMMLKKQIWKDVS